MEYLRKLAAAAGPLAAAAAGAGVPDAGTAGLRDRAAAPGGGRSDCLDHARPRRARCPGTPGVRCRSTSPPPRLIRGIPRRAGRGRPRPQPRPARSGRPAYPRCGPVRRPGRIRPADLRVADTDRYGGPPPLRSACRRVRSRAPTASLRRCWPRCGCPWPGAAPPTPRPRKTPPGSLNAPPPARASPDTLLLGADLLIRPAFEDAYDLDVRRHARALLHAVEALPAPDRPAEVAQLRRALVEAGEVDLAQAPAAG